MNPFEKIFERSEAQKEIEVFREKFTDKPFYQTYRNLYRLASGSRLFFGLLSVASGSVFLAGVLVASGLPLWLSGALGALVLVLVEILKNILTGTSAVAFLKTKKVAPAALVVVGLVALSAWVSLQGTQTFHQVADRTIENTKVVAGSKADSVRAWYDAQIKREEDALADYKNSVSWRGKIDASNKTTRQVIDVRTAQIGRLQTEKNDALARLQTETDASLFQAENTSERNLTAWLFMCLGNEVCIILAIVFAYYYEYRSAHEISLLNEDRLSVGLTELREIVQFFSPSDGGLSLPIAGTDDQLKPNQIGFNPLKPSEPENPENRPETRLKPGLKPPLKPGLSPHDDEFRRQQLRDYLAKYRHVVQSIQAGESITQIVQKHQVSKSTILNVRRCLRTLNAN